VRERDTDHLYLVATANTSKAAPEFGEDFADLFLVSLPDGLSADPTHPAPTADSSIRLHQLDHRRFEAADDWCDFAAGGGVSVSPEGLLCLYGAHHFRANGLFHATEFRADPPALPSGAYAWVDLFEHHDFAGRRLTIIGERDAAIPDYGKVGAQGRSFAGIASSVRYQLPDGRKYRLYRETGYRERPGEASTLTLDGNGRVQEIPDLQATVPRFGDAVMSSAYVP
jgi:YD repeat-containing protein